MQSIHAQAYATCTQLHIHTFLVVVTRIHYNAIIKSIRRTNYKILAFHFDCVTVTVIFGHIRRIFVCCMFQSHYHPSVKNEITVLHCIQYISQPHNVTLIIKKLDNRFALIARRHLL